MPAVSTPPKTTKVAWTFPLALAALAILGPAVGFAGVRVIWPDSPVGVDVDETPLLTFAAGTDQAQAQSLGLAGAFAATNNAASYTLTLNGISGGSVTVDSLVAITKDAAVTSYKVQVGSALSGINPTTLKARLWTGAIAPTADGDDQVCAVLDLVSATGTESSAACSASTQIQVIYTLPAGQTTESGTVTIRPSSIAL